MLAAGLRDVGPRSRDPELSGTRTMLEDLGAAHRSQHLLFFSSCPIRVLVVADRRLVVS
jgi:hypothetical protein